MKLSRLIPALFAVAAVVIVGAQELSRTAVAAPSGGGSTPAGCTNCSAALVSNALKSKGRNVNVSSSPEPQSGQVLTAVDGGAATWQSVGSISNGTVNPLHVATMVNLPDAGSWSFIREDGGISAVVKVSGEIDALDILLSSPPGGTALDTTAKILETGTQVLMFSTLQPMLFSSLQAAGTGNNAFQVKTLTAHGATEKLWVWTNGNDTPVAYIRADGSGSFKNIGLSQAAATGCAGFANLSGGTATIATTCIKSDSVVQITHGGAGVLANYGVLYSANIVDGASFDAKSANVLDSDGVHWVIINSF